MQHSNIKLKSAVYRGNLPHHYSHYSSQLRDKLGLNTIVSAIHLPLT